MSSSPQPTTDYVLGYSAEEHERLMRQAALLRPWTEKFFRAAGIADAMRVLDVGCGLGDVSMLAADLVGSRGTVTGVDRDGPALEQARLRVARQGLDNRVKFIQSSLDEFKPEEMFDAVVGRYILLYQPDAGAMVRQVAEFVRPGGIVVFHELDFGRPHALWPEPPLFQKIYKILGEAFRQGGAPPDFGLRLTRTFLDAGLGYPTVQAELPVGSVPGSPLFWWIATTIKTLLPRIEQFGLATAAELQVETLAQRMEAEALELGTQILGPVQFGAWTRKSADPSAKS